jgi:N-acetyl-gamma-glutamyl-phosphate reductase
MIKTGIVGITGFTGLELLKILSLHSKVSLEYVASRSETSKLISDIYPQFEKLSDKRIEKIDIDHIKQLDVVFLALPHTVSMEIAKEVAGYVKIVDLSADFRLKNIDTYKKWYKKEHTATGLIEDAVYGLCEINREKIAHASLVANPGCYATSIELPLAPILEYIDAKDIISDSKSGVSGAGRGLKEGMQFCEVNENFKAYSVAKHRHTPEIEEFLSSISNSDVNLTFSPHLLPIQRGMLSTIYVKFKDQVKKENLYDIYNNFYKDSFFIRIKDEIPTVNNVRGTNFCDIGFEIDERNNRVIIISVIDNLIKGASGQAVQNMNIMFNIDEKEGLIPYPYYP